MLTALERFFEAAECRTQAELADFLGIRQSSISDAKRRGSVPAEWLLVLWRKKRVNPDWILTGQGLQKIQTAEECSIEELMAEVVNRVLRRTD